MSWGHVAKEYQVSGGISIRDLLYNRMTIVNRDCALKIAQGVNCILITQTHKNDKYVSVN